MMSGYRMVTTRTVLARRTATTRAGKRNACLGIGETLGVDMTSPSDFCFEVPEPPVWHRRRDTRQPGPDAACRSELRILLEQAVAAGFGVDPALLRRPTRGRRRVAQARQAAMYLAHVCCGLSLTEAGRLFDRDRTTAAHACQVVEFLREEMEFDKALALLERIVRIVGWPWRQPCQPPL
jgi:Bacterial dnaA protein helix-turn-helix